MTKRNIIFLSRLFYPHVGGVEIHIAHVAEILIKNGYRITVICERHESTLPLDETWNGIHIIRVPTHLTTSKISMWKWMIKNISLFHQADIVHAHDVCWWYWPLRIVLPDIPLFTTFHGYEGVGEPTLGPILSRKLSEILSVGCICVGEWMKQYYHTHPHSVTYGAAACSPAPLPRQHSAVFIGRLSDDTGILTYIDAIKQMGGKVPLDVYGDGPLKQRVIELCDHTPYLRYNGVTMSVEKELNTHRFAFVSRYLGMIEAQQVGRLVFAHANRPIKQAYINVFPSAEHLVIVQNANELVQALHEYIAHPAKESRHVRAAQRWAKEQTWGKVADVYEELWKR